MSRNMAAPRCYLSLVLLALCGEISGKVLKHQPAVIHLDFGLHHHAAGAPTRSSWVYPRSLMRLPSERAVFCTNVRFPEDIFCEVGVVIEREFPDQYITEVNMTYPVDGSATCSVRLRLDEDNYSKARLSYDGFSCDVTQEGNKVPPFKVSDVENLTIRTRQYQNENYICWHEFKNSRVEQGADAASEGVYEEPNVKFVHDGISCISSISFQRDEED